MNTINTKLIIDTDPGVDDALAILFAIAAGMPIAAITTTYGNASIDDTTRNALTILELLHTTIPVYKGASNPLAGKPYYATVHGTNGLGGFEQKLTTKAQRKSVQQFLADKKTNEQYILACLGPTTNIAIARKNLEIVKKFDLVVILGGVLGEKGNVSPFAEFNVFNDPLALQTALTLRCKKVIIPIDVCRKVMFSKEDFDQISNSSLREAIKSITDMYISYYTGDTEHGGFPGGVMYDLLVPMFILHPELFTTRSAYIAVETEKNERFGEIRYDESKDSNCTVVTDVDSAKVKTIFFNTVNEWNHE